MSIKRGVGKEDVVHIYGGILLGHKKEQNCAICRMWIDLETVIQSKVFQKEKNKYINCLYMDSRKIIQMNLLAK